MRFVHTRYDHTSLRKLDLDAKSHFSKKKNDRGKQQILPNNVLMQCKSVCFAKFTWQYFWRRENHNVPRTESVIVFGSASHFHWWASMYSGQFFYHFHEIVHSGLSLHATSIVNLQNKKKKGIDTSRNNLARRVLTKSSPGTAGTTSQRTNPERSRKQTYADSAHNPPLRSGSPSVGEEGSGVVTTRAQVPVVSWGL